MKKLVNGILGAALAVMVSSVFIIGFAGCKTNAENNDDKKNHTAKSTDLIKFNISDAKYLATQWTDDPNKTKANANVRAAGIKTIDSLIKVTDEEKGEPKVETVIEVPKEEFKPNELNKLQPVREIYQCPYPNVKEEAKGVYTVFNGYVKDWTYSDGTSAPNIGQIMYVKPDGTSVDILNFDNDVSFFACTWIKRDYGENYIQFDSEGNVYILAKNDKGKVVIFKYEPTQNDKSKAVTQYAVNSNEEINCFRVTGDGQWIIVRTMVGGKYNNNNVYAIKADENSNAKPIALFQTDDKSLSVVDSFCINRDTDNIYWYVNEEQGGKMEKSGLYIAERINGSYSQENVKWYYYLAPWMLRAAIKEYITDSNKDYTGLLNYIKKFCGYKGKLEDIELNLSKMKDAETLPVSIPDIKEPVFYPLLSSLYKTDENGNPLKNEAALKYLIEETDIFKNFIAGGDFYLPLEALMFIKDTTETAYKMYDESNNPDILKSRFVLQCKGLIFTNKEGVWVYYNDDKSKDKNNVETYAKVFRLADANGKLTLDEPGNLSKTELQTIKYNGENPNKDNNNKWYRFPFLANTNGFAAISKDKKTIYYHSNRETKDLLENDTNKGSIEEIYSFSLDDEELIYNVKTSSGWIIGSVNLTSASTETEKPVTVTTEVESILRYKK